MRIALIAEDYYPQLGGVPEHVHHLATELNARGHDATVVTSRMLGRHVDPPFVRRVGTSLGIYSHRRAPGIPVRVRPRGPVDVGIFHPDGRPPAPERGGAPRLLFLGRLEPRTGLGTILAAMPRIAARFPGVELIVAGDGPWGSAYRRKAARSGLNVRFLGPV